MKTLHFCAIYHTICTILVRSIIFHYYVNEFRTYMPFQKVFCAVSFIDDEHNTVILTHSAPQKNEFLVKTKENQKSKKLIPKKRVYLELLHHRLGHRSTMSIMAGDLANIWQDFEFRVEPDPFCTSFQISRIYKKSLYQIHI